MKMIDALKNLFAKLFRRKPKPIHFTMEAPKPKPKPVAVIQDIAKHLLSFVFWRKEKASASRMALWHILSGPFVLWGNR